MIKQVAMWVQEYNVVILGTGNTNGDAPIAISGNNATFAGNITVSSDMRLKDNIQSLGQTMVNYGINLENDETSN